MILGEEKQNTRRNIRFCATLATVNPTRVDLGSNIYLYAGRPQPHHPIYDTPPEDLSLGMKWPKPAADYSPRSIGDVKN